MGLRNALKLRRLTAGDLTQQELADRVSCSRQTVNSIEKGKFNPSIELALKMAAALDCRVDELFYLEDEQSGDQHG